MKRFLVGLTFALVVASPTWGHGNLIASEPEASSRVRAVPTVVTLQLAEPPAPDSRFVVVDGCGDDVVTDVERDGTNVRLALAAAQPGRWNVDYRVVSATDGHLIRGDFAFRVAGPRDCAEPDGSAEPEPGTTDGANDVVGPGLEERDDGGSSPLLPLAAVGGGIVLVAFVIRKMTAS